MLRILFASTYCLLDTTSGAAVAIKELLVQLSARGFACEAVTASIFDLLREVKLESVISGQGSGVSSSAFPHLHPPPGGAEKGEGAPKGDQEVVEVRVEGVTHTVLRTGSSQRRALTPLEEEALLSLIESELHEFQPDILLTYGGLATERKIYRLARQRHMLVIFYLANAQYTNPETFMDVDVVVVPSKYLCGFYKERLGMQARVLYPIVSRERCVAGGGLGASSFGRFVTYINPVPEKGLGLFARVAAEAFDVAPMARFLVVEGRWGREEVVKSGIRLETLSNVTFMANQTDMKRAYSSTQIFLFPSFWNEGFGQSIVEAQLNGIPVLASRRGGIPEALNGGGFLLDIPERCTRDYTIIPRAEDVGPWVEKIRLLLENREVYEDMRRGAYAAARKFAPEETANAAADLFKDLLSKRARAGNH